MKEWKVYFSIRNTDGNRTEEKVTIEATSARDALDLAENRVIDPIRKMATVEAVAVCGVAIVGSDPFEGGKE